MSSCLGTHVFLRKQRNV